MAGRIPQQFIDDLLDRVDIVDVIDRRVKLKKTGKNYSARCPFHDEKTPSFSVNPEKQFYYCFGCGAGGNALGFVMDYENIDFPQAVDSLAGTAGMEVPREQSTGGSAPQGESPNKPLYAFMEQCASFYKDALRAHPQASRAVGYLKGRGLSGVVARDFGLGYAPPGWDNLIKARAETPERETLAVTAGMLVKNDAGRVYDRFRDRIVFPIRDRRGRVIAFGGRVMGDDKPKYLNSPETPIFQKGRELYGLYEARQSNRNLQRIIVVEGYMDVIALAQSGISNAVATLGTATSSEHLERIFRVATEVVFCFDGDKAGRQAAARALESALPVMNDGRQARFLFLREGDDPDSMVRRDGADVFNDLIVAAQPLEEFLFDLQGEGLNVSTMEGRASLSKRALPLLRQLPEGVFRELMFQALATRAGLQLDSLKRLEVPAAEPTSASAAPSELEPPPIDDGWPESGGEDDAFAPRQRSALSKQAHRHISLTEAAIALVLHRPSIGALADPRELTQLTGAAGTLLREMLELLQKRPESTTGMLLGHWHGSLEGEMLASLAGQERLIPAEAIEQQFSDILRRLISLPLRQRIVDEIEALKARNYAQLTDEDKARLRELIRALRDLETRTSAQA